MACVAIAEEIVEKSTPKDQWFRADYKGSDKRYAAFKGNPVWVKRVGSEWWVVNAAETAGASMDTATVKKSLESIYAPRQAGSAMNKQLDGVSMQNPIAESVVTRLTWHLAEIEDITEERLLKVPPTGRWQRGVVKGQPKRNGKRLADFYRGVDVWVRQHGDELHIVNPKRKTKILISKSAVNKYIDIVYGPHVANPIEGHRLDGVVGKLKKQGQFMEADKKKSDEKKPDKKKPELSPLDAALAKIDAQFPAKAPPKLRVALQTPEPVEAPAADAVKSVRVAGGVVTDGKGNEWDVGRGVADGSYEGAAARLIVRMASPRQQPAKIKYGATNRKIAQNYAAQRGNRRHRAQREELVRLLAIRPWSKVLQKIADSGGPTERDRKTMATIRRQIEAEGGKASA